VLSERASLTVLLEAARLQQPFPPSRESLLARRWADRAGVINAGNHGTRHLERSLLAYMQVRKLTRWDVCGKSSFCSGLFLLSEWRYTCPHQLGEESCGKILLGSALLGGEPRRERTAPRLQYVRLVRENRCHGQISDEVTQAMGTTCCVY
jgi:hypothetical protein